MCRLLIAAATGLALSAAAFAQASDASGHFRIGERLTYSVSLDKFRNVAYAELYVVSTGKIAGRDAVELRSRIKTLDFASAAFYLIDEERTTYAAADTGLPLVVQRKEFSSGLASESSEDLTKTQTGAFDLVSILYAVRRGSATGPFLLFDQGRNYNVSFQTAGAERVQTDAGDFETSVISVQSDFLIENGITDLKILLSNGEARIPVGFRLQTVKGVFVASLASIQKMVPGPEPTPTPVTLRTPRPSPTPTPETTPTPYVDNRPLPPDIAFQLGEKLRFRITAAGQEAGELTLWAEERKLIDGVDSLVLSAAITGVASASHPFALNDRIRVQVDPETLTPVAIGSRFSGALAYLTQIAKFDKRTGSVDHGGPARAEVPFGTHGILSLLYAMRSFNLRPARDGANPVNDTRVAVFWSDRATVFSLRPSGPQLVDALGGKLPGQLISIFTQVPQLDSLAPKVWLGSDPRRLPLRITLGDYQFDLISATVELPK